MKDKQIEFLYVGGRLVQLEHYNTKYSNMWRFVGDVVTIMSIFYVAWLFWVMLP